MSAEYLFVYGSLRSAFSSSARQVLEDHAQYIGEATFRGKLYKIDWYPGVVPSEEPDDKVVGEVYKIMNSEQVLTKLDRYEGCSPKDPKPHAFIREKRSVFLTKGKKIKAWIYLYALSVAGKEEIASGDYLKYQK